jgi:hypothetical protein
VPQTRVTDHRQLSHSLALTRPPSTSYCGAHARQDIAFWIPEDWQENNFAELVRNTCGDIVESVELIDQFTNPKKGKTSHCYRINYRAMDRSLTNEVVFSRAACCLPASAKVSHVCDGSAHSRADVRQEVDKLQEDVRSKTADELKCELR